MRAYIIAGAIVIVLLVLAVLFWPPAPSTAQKRDWCIASYGYSVATCQCVADGYYSVEDCLAAMGER